MKISIHALLAESDGMQLRRVYDLGRFLSTLSLRRATGILGRRLWDRQQFLSTLSLRRATGLDVTIIGRTWISIHALLAESDSKSDTATAFPLSFLSTLSLRRATPPRQQPRQTRPYFYPRSPCGERQRHYLAGLCRTLISIHALLAESDISARREASESIDFYPRSPCGERRQVKQTCRMKISISIHALLAESDPPQ